jgi:acyl-coenzyme A synthetase/AMP-(fatty) acid ligase
VQGNVVKNGERGLIACRKYDPGLFLGYFDNKSNGNIINEHNENNRRVFINDWYITGNVGMKDDEGYFYIFE